MLRTWRNSARLFSDFDNLQFAGVMGMVFLVMLLLFMPVSVVFTHGGSVDLPRVSHPVSMRAALREDAMKISVTRDGKVHFGIDHTDSVALPQKIKERLSDPTVERKIYIMADMRARWGAIKPVLDGVRAAGVLRVAFLVDQSRVPPVQSHP